MSARWLGGILGQAYCNGVAVELGEGVDFQGPFTLRYNTTTGLVEVELDAEAVAEAVYAQSWHTLRDFDFTAVANTELASDQSYDLNDGAGVVAWAKRNSAADTTAAAIENGTGLVLCPSAGLLNYCNNMSCPMLSTRLGDLLVDETVLKSGTPLRAMVYGYIETSVSTGENHVGVGLDYDAGSDSALVTGTHRYVNAAQSGGNAYARISTGYVSVLSGDTSIPTYDVPGVWMPNGVGGMAFCYGRGIYSAGWPSEIPYVVGWYPDSKKYDTAIWPDVGYAYNWSVSVYAVTQTANVGNRWVIERVKVEAFY